MDEDLAKSRRNLLVLSTLLLVFDLADVSIKKFSLLGSEVEVRNPGVVEPLLWATWIYLLVRYLQLLGSQTSLGLQEQFNGRMDKYLEPTLVRLVQEKVPDWSPSWNGGASFTDLSRRGLVWSMTVRKLDHKANAVIDVATVNAPTLLVLWSAIRSLTFVVLASPKVTEHVLPVVLAAVTLFAGVRSLLQ